MGDGLRFYVLWRGRALQTGSLVIDSVSHWLSELKSECILSTDSSQTRALFRTTPPKLDAAGLHSGGTEGLAQFT